MSQMDEVNYRKKTQLIQIITNLLHINNSQNSISVAFCWAKYAHLDLLVCTLHNI